MNIIIREAKETDLEDILALYAQLELDDGNVLKKSKAIEIFRRIESTPNYSVYIACLDDKIVGSFALLIMDNLGHLGSPSGVVEDVVVNPNLHRSGIGKAMMKFAIQICREKKCYKLALSTNLKRISAHNFYESLEFEKHGYSYLIELSE